MRSERNSNLEILRVLCILAIISDHFCGQSGVARADSYSSSVFFCTMVSLSRVSCNIFVIISSWYLCESSFKVNRLFRTWMTVITYTVPITLISKYLLHIEVTQAVLWQAFFPIEESPLWFAGYYIVLIALSPALNVLLDDKNQKALEAVLLFLTVFLVLYPTITAHLGFFSQDIWTFMYIYLITGYIKSHNLHLKMKRGYCLAVFLVGEIFISLVNGIATILAAQGITGMAMVREYAYFYRTYLQTAPNIIMAYSCFFIFNSLKVKKLKFVNKFAGATLGVYCFHQVPCFYEYLWKNIYHSVEFINRGDIKLIYAYTFLVIISIWLFGTLIELGRCYVICKLVEERKWYQKLCCQIDERVNK